MPHTTTHLEPYQFKPGCKHSAHNVQRRTNQVQMLKRAMLDCITTAEMQQLTRRMIDIAKGKNATNALKAIVAIWDRLYGRPKETIDLEVTSSSPFDERNLTDDEYATLLALHAKASVKSDVVEVEPLLPQQVSDKQPDPN